MPEYDSLNVHVGTLQKAEGLCTIRWIETHAVLCRERAGALALRRGMAITLPHCVDHSDANRRSRNVELDPGPTYEHRGFTRESQRAPPIGDEPRRDTHRDDLRGPAERREEVTDHRSWVGAASRNPMRCPTSKMMGRAPRAQHCPRQHDQ